MIALRTLQAGLFALGGAAIVIAATNFFLGAQFTGATAASIAAALFGTSPSPPALSSSDIDNELRFYSVFWAAYGVLVLTAARRLPETRARVRILLAIFFAGGVGRALSFATLGAPHDLFVVLMWVELLTAPALIALSFAIGGRSQR